MTDDAGTLEGSVYERMGRVLADLPAIGKNQRNTEQGFMFRGYDDVMNALNPLLAKHGVFFLPDVIERVTDKRATRNGGVMYEVNLHVRFTFYGPEGDNVSASGWGEGTDMGDKATNKAMTNALKYVLFQTFAISTQEAHETDTDRTTPEGTVEDVVPCRGCGEPIPGARTSPEPMRQHCVDKHEFVRLEDGTVLHPDKYAEMQAAQAAEAAARGEEPQAPPAAAPATPAPSSTTGENPVDDTPTNPPAGDAPADDADPYAYVEALKGQALMEEAERVGVAKGGTVAAVKARIVEALHAADAGPADDTDAGAADTAPQGAADAPDDAAGATDTPATDAADDGRVPDGDFACPGCDAEYPTEELYHAHWYAAHDTADDADGSAEDTTPAPGDDLADLVETIRGRVSSLTGEAARAYAKYRREAKLPRPEEITAEQATALLTFLDELAGV